MTDKQGRKNTTAATSHHEDTRKHTKPIDIPHGNGGEGLQGDHPVANVLDTSSQRREHRGKVKPEKRPAQQKASETDETAEQPEKEGGSPSSTQASGSFGAANNKNDPMRASTRTRTMSLYEMHAPYMS